MLAFVKLCWRSQLRSVVCKPMLLIVQVWVLDSNVGRVRDDARTDVERVVEEVAAIPLPVPSRKVCFRSPHSLACSVRTSTTRQALHLLDLRYRSVMLHTDNSCCVVRYWSGSSSAYIGSVLGLVRNLASWAQGQGTTRIRASQWVRVTLPNLSHNPDPDPNLDPTPRARSQHAD